MPFRIRLSTHAAARQFGLRALLLLPLLAATGAEAQPSAPDDGQCREAPALSKTDKFNFRYSSAQDAFTRSIGKDKVIGQIIFSRYNVFNMDDPDEVNWLYKLANRFNAVTWESVVRSQLLISEGASFNPIQLAESERLLRDLDFLYDARVVPYRVCGNVVDVEVVTRDIWTSTPP